MRQVTIYTTDKEYNVFVELAKKLPYVKRVETDDEPVDVFNNVKNGLKELQEFKSGKLKTTSAKDFLDDI